MKSRRIAIITLSILIAILGGLVTNQLQTALKDYLKWVWAPFVVVGEGATGNR